MRECVSGLPGRQTRAFACPHDRFRFRITVFLTQQLVRLRASIAQHNIPHPTPVPVSQHNILHPTPGVVSQHSVRSLIHQPSRVCGSCLIASEVRWRRGCSTRPRPTRTPSPRGCVVLTLTLTLTPTPTNPNALPTRGRGPRLCSMVL